ncbi:MAG: hypothetical protein HYT80_01490 [Euryarchaeota archaeon]|nr:hypothetical protein [Euryarchaeota archaeon]
MPAVASVSLSYATGPVVVFEALLRTLKALRWTVRERTERRVVVRSGFSIRSWGEEITVDVLARPSGGTRVKAESRILVGLWDWGKNRSNLARLTKALDTEIARVRH